MRKSEKSQTVCTMCGTGYGNIAFKGGYICENCIDVFKALDSGEDAK